MLLSREHPPEAKIRRDHRGLWCNMRARRFLLLLFLVALALAAFVFAANNPTQVSLWLGLTLGPLGVGTWVLAAFICGGVIGLALGFGLLRQIKDRVQIARLQGRLRQAEAQLAAGKKDHSSHHAD